MKSEAKYLLIFYVVCTSANQVQHVRQVQLGNKFNTTQLQHYATSTLRNFNTPEYSRFTRDVCGFGESPGRNCPGIRGRQPTRKWFFENQHQRCTEFEYGGCGGNANRFDSEEECKAACVEQERLAVDGRWSLWSQWAYCGLNCQQSRRRTCIPPRNWGRQCQGEGTETQSCNGGYCMPINGGWSKWRVWSRCSANCQQSRSHSCTNPRPQNGGRNCDGSDTQSRECYGGKCIRNIDEAGPTITTRQGQSTQKPKIEVTDIFSSAYLTSVTTDSEHSTGHIFSATWLVYTCMGLLILVVVILSVYIYRQRSQSAQRSEAKKAITQDIELETWNNDVPRRTSEHLYIESDPANVQRQRPVSEYIYEENTAPNETYLEPKTFRSS